MRWYRCQRAPLESPITKSGQNFLMGSAQGGSPTASASMKGLNCANDVEKFGTAAEIKAPPAAQTADVTEMPAP